MEEYFDWNLWIGDALYFVPQAGRTDEEKNKGAINFDDIDAFKPYQLKIYKGFRWSNLKVVQVGENHRHNEHRGHHKDSRKQRHHSRSSHERKRRPHNEDSEEYEEFEKYSFLPRHDMCEFGLKNSVSSIYNVAVNLDGKPSIITSSTNKGLFSFVSGLFTAVCDSPQQLFVEAFRDGKVIYNSTLVITNSKALQFTPLWSDIDKLSFTTCLPNPYGTPVAAGNTIFAIDDLQIVQDSEANILYERMEKELTQLREENKRIENLEKAVSELKKRIV